MEIKHGIRDVALNDMFQPISRVKKKSNQKWGTVHQRNSLKGDFNRKRDDTVMTSHYKNATWPAHVEGQHLPEAGGYKSIRWKFKTDHVYIYIYQNGGLEKVHSIEFLVFMIRFGRGVDVCFKNTLIFSPICLGKTQNIKIHLEGSVFK